VHPGHSVHFEHSVEVDSEYSDFEHSTTNFYIENMAQPPPREWNLREMATLISLMKACAFNILMRVFHMFSRLD